MINVYYYNEINKVFQKKITIFSIIISNVINMAFIKKLYAPGDCHSSLNRTGSKFRKHFSYILYNVVYYIIYSYIVKIKVTFWIWGFCKIIVEHRVDGL
jgi:hypothetical protein